ncbi:protein-L-isoaspartate(D-aspartate) O-methyltransferase [Roseospirillum parvum]|uniref:Protein-L-isoaspartate O-methyltransferase n=2 Tax=Roseospirillum parvum TaxID=83401 RepID=A0A1G8E5X5_9PROT|nr:protein-L-isoaspartate(D-aspartate) O-methyltransferase [Roseospirillum parvum]
MIDRPTAPYNHILIYISGLPTRPLTPPSKGPDAMDLSTARQNMITHQVNANRVTDPLILTALADIPRERFLPRSLWGVAYADEDLPVAPGRALMEPRVFARLLQAAEVEADEAALVVGCATGYAAAVLARLASAVVALEVDPALAAKATEALTDLGVLNATVVTGPLAEGYPDQAPYDVIFVDGMVPKVPTALLDQLADGGRLVAVEGTAPIGRGVIYTHEGQGVGRFAAFDAVVGRLPGFDPQPRFRF